MDGIRTEFKGITEANRQHLQDVQDNRNPCPICGDGVRVEDICSACMDRIQTYTCDREANND
mgnify:CR=1 FL=1